MSIDLGDAPVGTPPTPTEQTQHIKLQRTVGDA